MPLLTMSSAQETLHATIQTRGEQAQRALNGYSHKTVKSITPSVLDIVSGNAVALGYEEDARDHHSEIIQSSDRPLRSASPEARNVAGYVARRSNKTTHAEPPPTNTTGKQKSSSEEKTDKGKGKKKRSEDAGDDEESGSDHDERRVKEGEIRLRKRKVRTYGSDSFEGYGEGFVDADMLRAGYEA